MPGWCFGLIASVRSGRALACAFVVADNAELTCALRRERGAGPSRQTSLPKADGSARGRCFVGANLKRAGRAVLVRGEDGQQLSCVYAAADDVADDEVALAGREAEILDASPTPVNASKT